MKRFLLLFFLASCSLSQQERVAEDVAPLQSSNELRQERFVINAIGNPSAPFSLRLEPDFTLTADGIPPYERFVLAGFDPLKKTAVSYFEFEKMPDNKLAFFTPAGEPIAEPAPVVLKDYLKGQTVYLAAISKKNPTCNKIALVPCPYSLSMDDADFSLSVLHRRGTHFSLQGRGLIPYEPILIREQSGQIVRQHRILADGQGALAVAIEPLILGRLGGTASITIERAGIESAIDYAWGTRLESESRREKILCRLFQQTFDIF